MAKLNYLLLNCAFLFFSLTPALSRGEPVDDVYSRFKNDALNIWKKNVTDVTCSSGRLTSQVQTELSRENLPNTAKYQVNELVWHYLYPFCYSVTVVDRAESSPQQQADNATEVLCINPNYIFQIKRSSPASGWEIDSLRPVVNEEKSADLWALLMTLPHIDENLAEFSSLAKTCFGEYIMPDDSFFPALLTSPFFSVDRYELTKDNCLRIFFSVRTPVAQPTSCPFKFTGGEVVLIPDIWLIQSLRLSYGKWEQRMTCQYKGAGETSQQLTSKTVRTIFDDGRFMEDTYIFSHFPDTVDKNIFTLSNYNLPEPQFEKRNREIVRYCIMGLGLAMIAYGFVLMFQRRRDNRKALGL